MSSNDFAPLHPIISALQGSGGPEGIPINPVRQNYVGSVPAMTGTLFFSDAHLPSVRTEICACFNAFIASTAAPLNWVLREDPPTGSAKMRSSEAPALENMLAEMDQDDPVSFCYTSGKEAFDAGHWMFEVTGLPAWRAKMGGWGLCGLRFSVPMLFAEEKPGVFRDLFVDCARRLHAVHGYAGYGLVLSALRENESQGYEALVASMLRGFDAGSLTASAVKAHLGFKTVAWLTAINGALVQKVGGEEYLRSNLPPELFRFFDYREGVVIQAGRRPQPALATKPMPALLVLPNMLLRSVRAPEVRLHHASANGEPRLIGQAAQAWLARFDIRENEVALYRDRLLTEPKLIGD